MFDIIRIFTFLFLALLKYVLTKQGSSNPDSDPLQRPYIKNLIFDILQVADTYTSDTTNTTLFPLSPRELAIHTLNQFLCTFLHYVYFN